MEHTNDFDLYLDRLNVQDVLSYAGYKFIRRDGLKYPVFQKLDSAGRRIRGDKFVCMPGSKTCFRPPVIKSYNIVSLITNFPEIFPESRAGKQGSDLVHGVCMKILNMDPSERMTDEMAQYQHQQKPFDINSFTIISLRSDDKDSQRKFFPYFNSRCIGLMTQSIFSEHFMLATHKTEKGREITNLSFPLTIPGKDKNKIVGFEQRGLPRLDGSSGFKGKAAGSNGSEGLWIASPDNTALDKAKNIYWFESAYDAMAYFQLNIHKDLSLYKSVFLSTGGTPTVMQYKGVLNESPSAKHHLCFDNDLAGRQFVANFEDAVKKYTNGNIDYIRQTPTETFKDWNEELLGKTDDKKRGGTMTVTVGTGKDLDGDGKEDTVEEKEDFEDKKKQRYARHL